MTPDGSAPLPRKRYYDVVSWVVTQLAFAFVTTPFILLNLSDSMRAWASVYFYVVIGVSLSGALTASPAKRNIQQRLKARTTRPAMKRQESMEEFHGATLGVPGDPGKEFDEMVNEIVEEVKRRKGNKDLPEATELKKQVEENLFRRVKKDGSGGTGVSR